MTTGAAIAATGTDLLDDPWGADVEELTAAEASVDDRVAVIEADEGSVLLF